MSESRDGFVSIVHTHKDTRIFEVENIKCFLFSAIIRSENYLELAWFINDNICSSVLISKSMSSNDYGLCPSWNKSWDIRDNNRLSEYSSVQFISNCAIRGLPHLFEAKFNNSGFIRSNSSAFNTNFVLLDSISSIYSDLVIGSISILNTEVIVFYLNVQMRQDQLI